jgi:hypothetical protein
MVECSKCPLTDECKVYKGWIARGKESCQWINDHAENTVQLIFDNDSVPDWFGECPLVKLLR